jgi:hypothetical protein
MANILITQGTQSAVPVDLIGTVNYPISKIDIGALGASVPFTGTLGAVTNLAGGTLTALALGTVVGTVDTNSQLPLNWFNATTNTGTNTLGTLKAAVAGSAIYVTDLIISVGSTSTVVLGMGTITSPLIGTMNFNANGGMISNFRIPLQVTSGSALVYQQSVGCPMAITVTGFVK